eukprot:12886723-Prorocentrum_lima.AAC.1
MRDYAAEQESPQPVAVEARPQRVVAFIKGGGQVLADAFGSADSLPWYNRKPPAQSTPPMGELKFHGPDIDDPPIE